MTVIDLLLNNNRVRAAGFDAQNVDKIPRLRTAVVTCMDTRIDPLHIFGIEIGDVHVMRNAFAAVTDDMLRSLILSHHLLGIDEVVVMRHTDCGGIGLDETVVRRDIAERTGAGYDGRLLSFAGIEAAVRQDVAAIAAEPALANLGGIHGCIYDVATGAVSLVSTGSAGGAAGPGEPRAIPGSPSGGGTRTRTPS